MVTTHSSSACEIAGRSLGAAGTMARKLAKGGMLFCAGLITGNLLVGRPQVTPVFEPSNATNHAPVTASQTALRLTKLTGKEPLLGQVTAACWADLESADYSVYVRNLRAFGCPESTLRDIIAADLHAAYASYSESLRAPVATNFWDSHFGQRLLDPEIEAALQIEERQALAHIFGVTPAVSGHQQNNTDHCSGGDMWLEALAAPRRDQVSGIWRELKNEQQVLAARINAGVQSQAELDRYVEIDQETSDRMAALLTPEEFETFELHNSMTASGLRGSLDQVQVSETEFRALFRLSKEYEEIAGEALEVEGFELMDTWRAYLAGIQEVLGEERYSRFAQNKGLEATELGDELAEAPASQMDLNDPGL